MTRLTGSQPLTSTPPHQYPSVDRQIRRAEDRRPVSGRPQCNHLRCWNGCSRPFPSLPTALAPTSSPPPPPPASPLDPGKSSLRPRLSEPAVNRDWDPLVEPGLLTRSACDRLHSELIRPPRMLQLQLCVEELRQVRHINHHDWIDVQSRNGKGTLVIAFCLSSPLASASDVDLHNGSAFLSFPFANNRVRFK